MRWRCGFEEATSLLEFGFGFGKEDWPHPY